jgi:multidrug efflux pump subunit AcrA (membrane-fusion protein)
MANPGMPLVCVEGPSHLQVTAMVAESDISNIKTGMSVKLTIKSTNKTIEGKVSEMSLSAKNTGGQYIVKINLPKTDKSVLPGMFANVEFPIANTNVSKSSNDKILLPQSALIHQGQLTGVYTIGNDNAAILRWVRTGKTNGEQTEILSGISTGETYVLKAEGKIFNGAKLIIQ